MDLKGGFEILLVVLTMIRDRMFSTKDWEAGKRGTGNGLTRVVSESIDRRHIAGRRKVSRRNNLGRKKEGRGPFLRWFRMDWHITD